MQVGDNVKILERQALLMQESQWFRMKSRLSIPEVMANGRVEWKEMLDEVLAAT